MGEGVRGGRAHHARDADGGGCLMRSHPLPLVPMRGTWLLTLALLSGCQTADATPVDPSNATYTIDRRTVTLSNGVFEEPAAPGSAAKATTRLTDKRRAQI